MSHVNGCHLKHCLDSNSDAISLILSLIVTRNNDRLFTNLEKDSRVMIILDCYC